MKQNRMTRQPPEEIQPFLDNPFLKDFRGRDIIYTKDFYQCDRVNPVTPLPQQT